MTNITLVTALFDLKRGDLDQGFGRPFSQYLEHFEKLLKACFNVPMLVYVEQENVEFVKNARKGSAGTDIRVKSLKDFETWFPFFKEVQTIRTNKEWSTQVGWLENSPQAKLEFYNPLVMSKMFLLNDAVIFNPFDTDYYCWIDAGLTQTVHSGYFSNDNVFEKMEPLLDKFTFVCFPYDGADEIHGFKRSGMPKYVGEQRVERVGRGGFFGGHKKTIPQMNSWYYDLLGTSLRDGYMGTEESVFAMLTYTHKESVNVEMIEPNGLVATFFERVKKMPMPKRDHADLKSGAPENASYYQTPEEVAMNKTGVGTNLYVVTFNSPPQLQLLIDTFKKSNPELLKSNAIYRYIIDNSTDESLRAEYDRIAKENGFIEVIRKGNMGICGARQWAAKHFHESGAKYILWFEDDMLMEPDRSVLCKNGLSMHNDEWLSKCISIVEDEHLDFIKISFSEFFGDHHKQWSWHNVPEHVRTKYFPTGDTRMSWSYSGAKHGLSYLVGDVYFSNWPSICTRRGNWKIFLETPYEHPYEQTIMSHGFQLTKKGQLKSAVLMASLVNHNRVYHYPREIRKEC